MARRNPLARLRNNIRTIERGMTFKARGEELKQAKRDLPASVEDAKERRKKIGSMRLDQSRIDVQLQYNRYNRSIKRGEKLRDRIIVHKAKRVLKKI